MLFHEVCVVEHADHAIHAITILKKKKFWSQNWTFCVICLFLQRSKLMLFNQKLPSQFFLFLLCLFLKIQAKINSQIFAKQKITAGSPLSSLYIQPGSLACIRNHLNSCEAKRHIAKGWEKASIASVVNRKMQLPPEDPFEDNIPITLAVIQFCRLSGLLLFLYCAHLLKISSCVLSNELYDMHCIDSIHSKQSCFVLFIRFYVGQL